MTNLTVSTFLFAATDEPKGFMDTLPDPMKLDLVEILFVMVLVTLLFVFLKYVFFKPITGVMDEREAEIQAGGAKRAEAAALVESRQADYASRLKELRQKAFEHRKALAAAASAEKATLLAQAREDAATQRGKAMTELGAARETAKSTLMAQVDSLSETMVQHLLKQA
jgi:F0F1-type ATP synthase membrane subunit b/b'